MDGQKASCSFSWKKLSGLRFSTMRPTCVRNEEHQSGHSYAVGVAVRPMRRCLPAQGVWRCVNGSGLAPRHPLAGGFRGVGVCGWPGQWWAKIHRCVCCGVVTTVCVKVMGSATSLPRPVFLFGWQCEVAGARCARARSSRWLAARCSPTRGSNPHVVPPPPTPSPTTNIHPLTSCRGTGLRLEWGSKDST